MDANVGLTGRPIIGSQAEYLRIQDEINDQLLDLEEHAALLTTRHKERLRKLAGDLEIRDVFTVDDVTEQFKMVKLLRSKLLDEDNNLLAGADVKAISPLVSSINSLITLFLKHQSTIEHLQEISHLQEAINHVVKDFSPEDQRKFYKKLEECKQ